MSSMGPMFFVPGIRTRLDWLTTRITYLVVFGGEENMELATLLTDYVVYHLDGQEMYDLGGEAG